MKKQIKNLFQSKKSETDGKPSKKTSYIIVIGLIGLLLIILGNVFSSSSESDGSDRQLSDVTNTTKQKPAEETFSKDKSSSTSDVSEIEKSYEEDLREMLNKINGVSEVEVMVNLESTKVKVYEKNLITGQQTTEESDKNGGTREIEDSTKETQVVLVNQGDKEVPLLIQTKKPEVRGVFVVAKGVDHATVEQRVIEATSRVLDVPTHRVSVMPKN
ncbi:stage III sporulation protein AG [Virgibacillus doumboii]|uniref:stage III sporulation protein AG n=1 Tax=Virgibacillus doumboii TaxID=2697503 RepID=UPI001FE4F968|nr:stage III sporulation protein AG [Virgibacillus doumboii]